MNLYLRKAFVRELARKGYEDAEARVRDYEEYYYTGNETEEEALFIMENLKKCTSCGDFQVEDMLEEQGLELVELSEDEVYCPDCRVR